VQSSSQIITTNTYFFTGRMPLLLPNQQCQSTEGKSSAKITPSVANSSYENQKLCGLLNASELLKGEIQPSLHAEGPIF